MCEDMLRAGYQHFIVDPGVRQAYFPETAEKLYTDKVRARQAPMLTCRTQELEAWQLATARTAGCTCLH